MNDKVVMGFKMDVYQNSNLLYKNLTIEGINENIQMKATLVISYPGESKEFTIINMRNKKSRTLVKISKKYQTLFDNMQILGKLIGKNAPKKSSHDDYTNSNMYHSKFLNNDELNNRFNSLLSGAFYRANDLSIQGSVNKTRRKMLMQIDNSVFNKSAADRAFINMELYINENRNKELLTRKLNLFQPFTNGITYDSINNFYEFIVKQTSCNLSHCLTENSNDNLYEFIVKQTSRNLSHYLIEDLNKYLKPNRYIKYEHLKII